MGAIQYRTTGLPRQLRCASAKANGPGSGTAPCQDWLRTRQATGRDWIACMRITLGDRGSCWLPAGFGQCAGEATGIGPLGTVATGSGWRHQPSPAAGPGRRRIRVGASHSSRSNPSRKGRNGRPRPHCRDWITSIHQPYCFRRRTRLLTASRESTDGVEPLDDGPRRSEPFRLPAAELPFRVVMYLPAAAAGDVHALAQGALNLPGQRFVDDLWIGRWPRSEEGTGVRGLAATCTVGRKPVALASAAFPVDLVVGPWYTPTALR